MCLSANADGLRFKSVRSQKDIRKVLMTESPAPIWRLSGRLIMFTTARTGCFSALSISNIFVPYFLSLTEGCPCLGQAGVKGYVSDYFGYFTMRISGTYAAEAATLLCFYMFLKMTIFAQS